jgi:hypothetical protein
MRLYNRVINEIQVTGIGISLCLTPQNDFYILADEGLSAGKHVVERFKKSLTFNFGDSLANSQSNEISMTDELQIGRIDQYEAMLWALQKRGKALRPGKHISEALELLVGLCRSHGMTAVRVRGLSS